MDPMLPMSSVLGYWAMSFGTLEVQELWATWSERLGASFGLVPCLLRDASTIRGATDNAGLVSALTWVALDLRLQIPGRGCNIPI